MLDDVSGNDTGSGGSATDHQRNQKISYISLYTLYVYTHTHTHYIYIHIFIYIMCVCVCVILKNTGGNTWHTSKGHIEGQGRVQSERQAGPGVHAFIRFIGWSVWGSWARAKLFSSN